jgi:hypothetical protein
MLAQRGDESVLDSRAPDRPLLTSPTPRTVTDERQARITAEVIPGPEVAAGTARGTITAVAAKPADALADGAVLFQSDGMDRV